MANLAKASTSNMTPVITNIKFPPIYPLSTAFATPNIHTGVKIINGMIVFDLNKLASRGVTANQIPTPIKDNFILLNRKFFQNGLTVPPYFPKRYAVLWVTVLERALNTTDAI